MVVLALNLEMVKREKENIANKGTEKLVDEPPNTSLRLDRRAGRCIADQQDYSAAELGSLQAWALLGTVSLEV